MTKGDLMKKLYTPEELRNVDSAIPFELSEDLRQWGLNPDMYVMDYNNNGTFGQAINLAERYFHLMYSDKVIIVDPVLTEEDKRQWEGGL